MDGNTRRPNGVRCREDAAIGKGQTTHHGKRAQHQPTPVLLRAFDELASGSPTTDVTASTAAQGAGFDPDSREFERALGYPNVDVGYLARAGDEGEEALRITVAGINEVQRRPQL